MTAHSEVHRVHCAIFICWNLITICICPTITMQCHNNDAITKEANTRIRPVSQTQKLVFDTYMHRLYGGKLIDKHQADRLMWIILGSVQANRVMLYTNRNIVMLQV